MRTLKSPKFIAFIVTILLGIGLWRYTTTPTPAQLALRNVKTWDYQLQHANLDRLAQSSSDMVVMDYARSWGDKVPYSRADVERVRRRADGRPRLVIAYLSIGEAEEYRPYWRAEWKQNRPAWLLPENCRWPGNYLVKFWMNEWKQIMFAGQESYLARIMAAGFDGVYLDRIDAYWDLREQFPQGKADMIKFVQGLATRARQTKPDFLVIAQNAEDLLADKGYRRAIDGVAKEDLLHGVDATGMRNDAKLISWSLGQLAKLKPDNKPLFAIEYLTRLDQKAATAKELAPLGVKLVFPSRALDGADPFEQLTPPATDTKKAATGTPEYSAQHCK
jgi:cysteinyl-tRNA synthetase, unknown class